MTACIKNPGCGESSSPRSVQNYDFCKKSKPLKSVHFLCAYYMCRMGHDLYRSSSPGFLLFIKSAELWRPLARARYAVETGDYLLAFVTSGVACLLASLIVLRVSPRPLRLLWQPNNTLSCISVYTKPPVSSSSFILDDVFSSTMCCLYNAAVRRASRSPDRFNFIDLAVKTPSAISTGAGLAPGR